MTAPRQGQGEAFAVRGEHPEDRGAEAAVITGVPLVQRGIERAENG